MPRLPYLTDEQAGPPELVAAIRARRGGRLGNLDRILLHSPPVATGWGQLMGRVRNELALSPKLKELAMCAVAVLNRADYELHHHAPLLLAAGGTQAQIDALAQLPASAEREDLFDAAERATLALTVQMTRDVAVSDAVFDSVRQALGEDRLVFELITVIAAYNMVSRILVAVGIDIEA
ncbi:MAG: carboxymuconolactone decarboxylase family protein [Burkholderiales bacterium]|nr:carboxymuconolactone decarboxylase family protein [Burkholderiales bacterium]